MGATGTAMASAATADAMGAGTWAEPTTVAATIMRMATAAATTTGATTTAMCRLTTTVRHSTDGPTILGRRRLFTHGVGAERRGTEPTGTISIRIRLMPPQHCGCGTM